jgi:hypothetical protein
MGSQLSADYDFSTIISTVDNDYNPFNIPSIRLKDPSEFNPGVAIYGCPPLIDKTKAEFANFPVTTQAAFADGVVRGSWEEKWMQDQCTSASYYSEGVNNSSIGGLAYLYLKTQNTILGEKLEEWNNMNKDNHNNF